MNAHKRMNRDISLADSEVHLWLAFYDQISDQKLHAAYRKLLSPAEMHQEARFYFDRDKRRYLVTRALLRTTLSRYASIGPKEWTFSTNAYGRPEISNAREKELCVSFNFSHTHSLIVLGVTKRSALGVDVENWKARAASIDIAERYFASREVTELRSALHDQRQRRFFEYWTLKEAYIKARGMGLSIPLDKFSFHYSRNGAVAMAIDPELDDEPERWRFWQFCPAPDYLVAICAERIRAKCGSLTVWQCTPMLSEEELSVRVLHASE